MDSNRRPAGYEPAAIDQLSYVAITAVGGILVAGAGFEPRDLRVMSPTSYLAALPRDMCFHTKLYHFIRLKVICQLFLRIKIILFFSLTIASGKTLCYNLNMISLSKYSGMRICVALSGGRDSMALAHFLHAHADEYGIELSALNCDHKIRGKASADDSLFVREWCKVNNIPLMFFEWTDDLPKTESAARRWRRDCYKAAMSENSSFNCVSPSAVYPSDKWRGADAVATAHHLNDNAETVLFNLARGAALSGMTGINDNFSVEKEKDDGQLKIIHPLVAVPREEIDRYVTDNGVPYVDDATNFTEDYTRNKIRLNVLPELEKAVPGAAKAIYRFSRLASDDEQYFEKLIKDRKLVKKTRTGYEIALCNEMVIFKRAVIMALTGDEIKDYTSEHARMLYELQFAEKGKKFEFLGFTAFKEEGKIAICHNSLLQSVKEGILFNEHLSAEQSFFGDVLIHVSDGGGLDDDLLAFEAAAEDDNRVPKKFAVLRFDGGAIPETAVIRFMRDGDKFKKFGGGTKNLGDYFTDRKIPVRLRKLIPLIADGNEVLAAGGVEISDKIKITENTKNTLYLICADYTAE